MTTAERDEATTLDLAIDAMQGGPGVGPEEIAGETRELADLAWRLQTSRAVDFPQRSPVKLPKEKKVGKFSSFWWGPKGYALAVAGLLVVFGGGGYGLARLGAPASVGSGGVSYFVPTIGSSSSNGAANSNGAPSSNGSANSGVAAPSTYNGVSGVATAPNAGAALYPYEYGCEATPQASTTTNSVSATGFAEITANNSKTVFALSINLNGRNSTGSLVKLQAQVNHLIADLENLGVPAGSISSSLSSYLALPSANGIATPGNSSGSVGGAPAIAPSVSPSVTTKAATAYNNTSAYIEVTVNSAALADQAAQVAAGDGASYVSLSGEQAYPEPDSSVVQKATDQAVSSAQGLAQAAAQSAGVSLGSVQSLTVTPPSFCGGYGNNGDTVISVTVVYNIAR